MGALRRLQAWSGSRDVARAEHSTCRDGAVEGLCTKLNRRRLKHGVFHALVDLQAAINRCIDEHNRTEAKPFIWTADQDKIIAARIPGFQSLESIHQAFAIVSPDEI